MGPMLGFKRFFNARRVVAGVELVQKIVKGQFDVPASFGKKSRTRSVYGTTCWRRESCAYLQQIRLLVSLQLWSGHNQPRMHFGEQGGAPLARGSFK